MVLKPDPGKKGATSESSDYIVKVAASIRAGFGYVPNPQSRDPVDMQMIQNGMSRIHPPGEATKARAILNPRARRQRAGSDHIRPSDHATEGGKFLFDQASSVLTDQTKAELTRSPKWSADTAISDGQGPHIAG